ncbi:hypothetical protein LINGRAHAP2_LOCUS33724 [Linum grandiflorum]
MATAAATATLVAAAMVILLSHTADVRGDASDGTSVNCGTANQYSNFPNYVDTVLQALVEGTSPDNPSYLYFPDGRTVGTALGKASCYTPRVKGCKQCLQVAKFELSDCHYNTYGQFDDGTCAMQYWQIGA